MEFVSLWFLWSIIFLDGTNAVIQNPSVEELNSIHVIVDIAVKHIFPKTKDSSSISNKPSDNQEIGLIQPEQIPIPNFDILQELFVAQSYLIMAKQLAIEAAGRVLGKNAHAIVECAGLQYGFGTPLPTSDQDDEDTTGTGLWSLDGEIAHNVYTYQLESPIQFGNLPDCLSGKAKYLVQNFKTKTFYALFCINGETSKFFRSSSGQLTEDVFQNQLKAIYFVDKKGVKTILVGPYVAFKFTARVTARVEKTK